MSSVLWLRELQRKGRKVGVWIKAIWLDYWAGWKKVLNVKYKYNKTLRYKPYITEKCGSIFWGTTNLSPSCHAWGQGRLETQYERLCFQPGLYLPGIYFLFVCLFSDESDLILKKHSFNYLLPFPSYNRAHATLPYQGARVPPCLF